MYNVPCLQRKATVNSTIPHPTPTLPNSTERSTARTRKQLFDRMHEAGEKLRAADIHSARQHTPLQALQLLLETANRCVRCTQCQSWLRPRTYDVQYVRTWVVKWRPVCTYNSDDLTEDVRRTQTNATHCNYCEPYSTHSPVCATGQ